MWPPVVRKEDAGDENGDGRAAKRAAFQTRLAGLGKRKSSK